MQKLEFLLAEIHKSLSEKDRGEYATSIEALMQKFDNVPATASLDNYCVECLTLFNKEEIGFPQELYKGLNSDDINAYVNDLARDFKQFMCAALKNNDVNLTTASNDALKNSVQYLIGAIATQAGFNNFLIVVFVCGVIQYCIANNIDNICV